ncbi:uncharacterized protein Dyak_GE11274 [Drosophila yakuba]|uniref:Uncharacterized protein n=1 Tax=Drosophila yakuba TaxID=7245 RepID=B4IST7_DROYA|nr:uncharacterized protein Dyak_GE11274 [Drosophila yakuba]
MVEALAEGSKHKKFDNRHRYTHYGSTLEAGRSGSESIRARRVARAVGGRRLPYQRPTQNPRRGAEDDQGEDPEPVVTSDESELNGWWQLNLRERHGWRPVKSTEPSRRGAEPLKGGVREEVAPGASKGGGKGGSGLEHSRLVGGGSSRVPGAITHPSPTPTAGITPRPGHGTGTQPFTQPSGSADRTSVHDPCNTPGAPGPFDPRHQSGAPSAGVRRGRHAVAAADNHLDMENRGGGSGGSPWRLGSANARHRGIGGAEEGAMGVATTRGQPEARTPEAGIRSGGGCLAYPDVMDADGVYIG